MEAAIAEREKNGPFKSLEDFASRMDSRAVNKRMLEALVKAGAFDFTGETRAGLFERLDQVLSSAAIQQKDRKAGQGGLFDNFDFGQPAAPSGGTTTTSARPEWPHDEVLAYEKELLGFYVSGHPLDSYRGHFDSSKLTKLGTLDEVDTSGKPVTVWVAGIVNKAEVRYSKKDNRPFATLLLEDFTGQTEVMCWSDEYEKYKELFQPGAVLGLRCRCSMDQRTEQNRLTVSGPYQKNRSADAPSENTKPYVMLLEPKKARRRAEGEEDEASGQPKEKALKPAVSRPVIVRLNTARHSAIDIERIHEVIVQHPGDTPFLIEFVSPDGKRLRMKAADEFKVADTRELRDALVIWG